MSLGKLIKEKIKEMDADWSGEYVDKVGKHFEMKKCESGYTIGYGGGKSIECDNAMGIKLAKECRKLSLEDKKDEDKEKDLSKEEEDSITPVRPIPPMRDLPKKKPEMPDKKKKEDEDKKEKDKPKK